MCGIAGFLGGPESRQSGEARSLLERMAGCIRHRGPDHSAVWSDPETGIALAHNRLAIVDLTPAGNQPMDSASGRFVTVYNGEIYNHLAIRDELRAGGFQVEWRGHSDTETLLAAIEAWGIEGALGRATGMFALALWDRREKTLILARDRLGEKPLYYGWQGSGANAAFLFGSELKALATHPAFIAEVDRRALSLYMRHNYVPGPWSIYRGIAKLTPGSYLTLSAGEREPRITAYWSGAEVARQGVADPLRLSPQESVDELDTLLRDAVGRQMMADVPLGAFLSGGVDSSTVVALMQAQSPRPVKTFTIGFNEQDYNEAVHAKAVAAHLGTDHTELYVTSDQALAVVPRLPGMYDEPFADSSQIPTFLVSELARRHVTVSLSGDAGDELFAGYNRYLMAQNFWRRLHRVPRPLRTAVARGLTSLSPARWTAIASTLEPILPDSMRMRLPGDKIHKGAGVLGSRSSSELYHGLVSSWRSPEDVVVGGHEPPTLLTGDMPDLAGLDDIERMMALDMLTYMPDDILAKVDRAAMSVSLETRVPFLDHRVVEHAWRMPLQHKLRDGQTKWALRQVLYRYVPSELIERPKMGFGVPVGEWLRGPMRDWAEALLDPARLQSEGYFRPEPIRRMWQAHLEGHVNEQYRLWIVLMFQAWLEAQPALGGRQTAAPARRAA
ncbi:MAG TPA: asparagine synthase (glutamine-hydrolyzing) [Allosphingosinicella sp.]|jgi:asparagine synthase (glutamine-hydrolysing)